MQRTFRTRALVFLFAGMLSTPLLADRLKKAFEALEMHDYFRARELFTKEVKSNPAAAWYGLSVITGRSDNPFYQLDTSFACIQRADNAWTLARDKERLALQEYGVNGAAIEAQKERIYEVAWEQTRALNTIADYDNFIRRFASSSHVRSATEARDQLAFQAAREKNTAEGYTTFLERYPGAKETYEARNRLQEAIYREAAPTGTVAEYEQFLQEHPQSPYVRNAEDELYRLSTPAGTPEEMMAFIRRYPKNPHVPEAWRAIYVYRTRDLSTTSITGFLRDYPDYPFVEELTEDFNAASLVLYPFRQGGKWGFIDVKGVERIKAVYEFAEAFEGGQAQVGRDSLTGTINKLGREVIPISYDDVLGFSEGLATVERGDRSGVVDRTGKLVVKMEYDEVGEFSGGLAYAEKDGKYGYIDPRGNVAVPFTFDGANTFKSGVAVVEQGGLFGVIDNKGNVVVPFQYDWIEGYAGKVSRVRKGDRMGVISPFGDVLLPVEHDQVGPFNDGLALVADKGKCGYVNAAGQFVVPQQYMMPENSPLAWGDFHNGVARVMVAGKMALIDAQGTRIFPAQYVDIGAMESGAVPVKKKSKWGFASRAFTTITDARYDGAWEMHEGYARVRIGQLFGLIDSTGREVLAPAYGQLGDVRQGLTVASDPAAGSTGQLGVIEVTGKVRIPFAYDLIEFVDRNMAMVGRGSGPTISGMKLAYMRLDTGEYIWKEEGFETK